MRREEIERLFDAHIDRQAPAVPVATHRCVITSVPGERLLEYLAGRRALVLPEGCELVSFWSDEHRRVFLKLSCHSFKEVPIGTPIPRVKCRSVQLRQAGPMPAAKIETTRRRVMMLEEIIESS